VTQTFSIWAYGDKGLVRGSGLYVSAEGVACNHHFLPSSDGGTFEFSPGDYVLQVYASIVGRSRPILLTEVRLLLPEPQVQALRANDAGVWFDWGPGPAEYGLTTHADSGVPRGRRPRPAARGMRGATRQELGRPSRVLGGTGGGERCDRQASHA